MKNYEKPSFEINTFDVSDVITASSAIDSVISGNGQSVQKTVDFNKLNL